MSEILDNEKKKLNFDLANSLKDKSIVNSFENRKNSFKNPALMNARDELTIDIFENEVIKLLEKNPHTKEEIQTLYDVKNLYTSFLGKSPEILIESRLIKSPYSEILFFDNKEMIVRYKNKLNKTAGDGYKKFIKGETLTKQESLYFFKYLSARLEDANERFSNIFKNTVKKILESEEDVDIFGKEFLIKFAAHEKCKKLGLEVPPIYITTKDLYHQKPPTFNGVYYGLGTISINYQLLNKNGNEQYCEFGVKNKTKWIQTIHHELQHYKQDKSLRGNEFNLSAWNYIISNILSVYLSDENYDEYMTNYKFRGMEREANAVGWRETAEFLNTYSPNFDKEVKAAKYMAVQTKRVEKYGINKEKNDQNFIRLVVTEKYTFENLSRIIKDNPYLLDTYRILRLFFDQNGLKDFKTIIREFSKQKGNAINIINFYKEIFSYYLIKTNLFDVNLRDLTDKEKLDFYGMVSEIYQDECRSLKDMMDTYVIPKDRRCWFDEIDAKEGFKNLGLERIRRIKKYYKFLEHDSIYIQTLKSKVDRNYVTFGARLRMEDLGMEVASFADRVDIWNPEFKSTEFADELRNLPLIMDDKTFETVMMEKKEQIYGTRK